jgi:phytoene synthase
VFDLYDDPMGSVNDLEGYCGETSSSLIRLASLILSDGDTRGADAAGHAGVAYAVTGLIRSFPWHVRRGQLYVPAEILEPHGIGRAEVVSGQGGAALRLALSDMRGLARRHLEQARILRSTVAPAALPAFLPLALVPAYLDAMERPDYDPYGTVVEVPAWRKLARLWWAARRGQL